MAWSVVQVLAIVKCSTFRAIIRAPFLFSVFPAQLTAVIGAGQFALPFFFLNFLWASCNPCCWLDVWRIQCFVIFPHGRRSGRESWNLMQPCKGSTGVRGTARPGASEHWHQQLCGDYYSFLILILMYSEIEDTTFSLAFHRAEDSSVLPVAWVRAVDSWVQACLGSPQLLMGQTIIWYIYFPCTLTYTQFVVVAIVLRQGFTL